MARLGIDLHDEGMRDRLERLFWQLAQELLQLGTSVILEFGLWVRVERDEKRLEARALGVGVELYYLDVPAEELWRHFYDVAVMFHPIIDGLSPEQRQEVVDETIAGYKQYERAGCISMPAATVVATGRRPLN